ncbi:hypothetical protein EGW08_023841 [Elysia chlorotica]|uniref:Ig-like domain-containing protein n=1 Tax=Elysia chlorotica TaxID=188477 RepID=A0A3S0Z3C9_ELYCH|nr:hypothetical protein EGW08_023841 [Elysia chlorotica]
MFKPPSFAVSQPYTITWTFTPHNMDAVSTIMTATHQGQQQFMTLTPDPVKYRDTGGPHLRVYDLLLSDAGLYRCQSNLTGETASAQLYVVGMCVGRSALLCALDYQISEVVQCRLT